MNPLSITKEYSFEGFQNSAPILVDVGACKGEFAEEFIRQFPEKNFVLFEIRVPLAQKLKEKFAGNKNVVVFDGDAGRNFESILRPSVERGRKLETVFINFPDPWFKERHKKRRFLNKNFLNSCAEWIMPETKFIFQTDQEFLFLETLELVRESAFSQVEFFDEPPFGISTDWEQAKLREGEKIWRMKFYK
ncbi:hypothetical protein K9M59_01220 [Candidatus Gracilibacteria bacterium]|nr:hypothetical protein [Candidatus Gracilibacteria bacterium]MCF7819188.1 hypothetical protein [Candidatus Gracilibacteria bacterium]